MEKGKNRILIVEDEESIRRSLRAWLEDEDFDVLTAESGEQGLEILSRHAADGAIVDIRLPGMDGALFIKQAHVLCPQLRFLVYTGSVNFRPLPDLLELGVGKRDIFQKPLSDLGVLVAAIRNRIGIGQSDDE